MKKNEQPDSILEVFKEIIDFSEEIQNKEDKD